MHVMLQLAFFKTTITPWRSCAGNKDPSEAAQSHSSNTFEWCGADYSLDDLQQATELLLSPTALEHGNLAEQSMDVWCTTGWAMFKGDAQHLLNALADRRALPEVSDLYARV